MAGRGEPGVGEEPVALVDELVDARLLSTSLQPATGGDQHGKENKKVEVVDLIHESLLGNWGRLREAVAAQRRHAVVEGLLR